MTYTIFAGAQCIHNICHHLVGYLNEYFRRKARIFRLTVIPIVSVLVRRCLLWTANRMHSLSHLHYVGRVAHYLQGTGAPAPYSRTAACKKRQSRVVMVRCADFDLLQLKHHKSSAETLVEEQAKGVHIAWSSAPKLRHKTCS